MNPNALFIDDEGSLVQIDSTGEARVLCKPDEWDGNLAALRNSLRADKAVADVVSGPDLTQVSDELLTSLGTDRVRFLYKRYVDRYRAIAASDASDYDDEYDNQQRRTVDEVSIHHILEKSGSGPASIFSGPHFWQASDGFDAPWSDTLPPTLKVWTAKEIAGIKESHFRGRRPSLYADHLVLRVPTGTDKRGDVQWQSVKVGRLLASTYANEANIIAVEYPSYLPDLQGSNARCDGPTRLQFASYGVPNPNASFRYATERLTFAWLAGCLDFLKGGSKVILSVDDRHRAYERRVQQYHNRRNTTR